MKYTPKQREEICRRLSYYVRDVEDRRDMIRHLNKTNNCNPDVICEYLLLLIDYWKSSYDNMSRYEIDALYCDACALAKVVRDASDVRQCNRVYRKLYEIKIIQNPSLNKIKDDLMFTTQVDTISKFLKRKTRFDIEDFDFEKQPKFVLKELNLPKFKTQTYISAIDDITNAKQLF